VDLPRRAAYDVLRAVDERGSYANLVLPGLLRERGIQGRDAAFATELTYGTLRAQGTLDAVLASCLDRPLQTVDPPVRDVLRLGAYQLLRTRVPSHAAVSATVELARAVLSAGPVAFVNAVLRAVSGKDEAAWLDALAPPLADDPLGALALRHAHPRWVVSAFRDALGGDLDETARALAADDERPQVHLAARPGRIERNALASLSGGTPGPWSPYAVRLDGGDPGDLAPIRDGRAGVQDEGSQLAALALLAAPLDDPAGPDREWLDLCAGPGGKAALLGAVAAQRGARLLAVEKAPHRARLVERATRDLPVEVVAADATELLDAGGRAPFDRVLVDAPCSGLGALRRRPEARWRRSPADLPGLTALQRTLLLRALEQTRPGGLVAYVTCSPHLAETVVPVADAVRRTGASLLDARPLLPGVPDLGDGPTVQLWPHHHGTDAMFIAVMRRG